MTNCCVNWKLEEAPTGPNGRTDRLEQAKRSLNNGCLHPDGDLGSQTSEVADDSILGRGQTYGLSTAFSFPADSLLDHLNNVAEVIKLQRQAGVRVAVSK